MKIKYRDLRAYKYELAETYTVQTNIRPIGSAIDEPYFALSKDGFITIARGYCWDGPSGPAIDSPTFMRGSLVHDAFYQMIRMGLLPKDKRGAADRLLYRMVLEDGMSHIRAAWVYSAVRGMGWTACAPRPLVDVVTIKVAP